MLLMRQALVSVCALFICVATANGQTYPNRVIKLVVPYPAGGVVDITGRLLADHLQKALKATVIVENKVGAGGTIGASFVAKAEPDGYTILLSGAATHAFAPALFKSLPYDPVSDFAPITQITEGYLALTVPADSGIKDVASFVRTMKDKGASSNYASNGHGTYPHLAMCEIRLGDAPLDRWPRHHRYSALKPPPWIPTTARTSCSRRSMAISPAARSRTPNGRASARRRVIRN